MSAEVPDVVPEPSVASEMMNRRRLTLILAVLLVEFGIFFAGLFTPLSASTRQALANQTGSQLGSVQTGSTVQLVAFIFTHNLPIALGEMIPLAGALLFGFSVYTTGLAAQALVASQGLPPQWGAAIFAFPYSIVELTAYAVAVASGFALLTAWRRRRLKLEVKIFALEGALVFCILLVAAVMEAATIRVSFILGFALWLPTALALAATIMIAGRRRG